MSDVRPSAGPVPGRSGTRTVGMARRRRAAAGARRRWLAALVVTLAAAALGAGVWWLLTSPRFEVAKLESSRYRFTRKAELDACLRGWLERRMNIWTLDTAALRAEVVALTWIRRAEIERHLPSTLRVNVWEWRPLLLVADDGDGPGRAMVESGEVLPLPAHLPAPDLPLLVADTGAAPLDEAETMRVLSLLNAIRETGLETENEVDFIVREARGLAVVLAGGGRRLVVGREDFTRRLQRYLSVTGRLPDGAEIDLRFERQVYIDETT